MSSEKRLINVWKLVIDLAKLERSEQYGHENVLAVIASQETVDAVEVVQIKEVMQKILETLDNLIAVDEPLANDTAPSSSYYCGKVNSYEVARRLVNAAMTDLCDNCGADMRERKNNG